MQTQTWLHHWDPRSCAKVAALAAASIALAFSLAGYSNQAMMVSVVREAAVSHGLDPDDFLRMADIESGLDPYAYHPASRASGLFQFLPATARQYKLDNVFDARANANAAAALWLDNRRALRKGLGRSPTSGEMYLAHQQGAGGAIKLITRPDEPATEVVGYGAVTRNGGTGDMTAQKFASLWIDRFEQD
jgi:hypothetical protein